MLLSAAYVNGTEPFSRRHSTPLKYNFVERVPVRQDNFQFQMVHVLGGWMFEVWTANGYDLKEAMKLATGRIGMASFDGLYGGMMHGITWTAMFHRASSDASNLWRHTMQICSLVKHARAIVHLDCLHGAGHGFYLKSLRFEVDIEGFSGCSYINMPRIMVSTAEIVVRRAWQWLLEAPDRSMAYPLGTGIAGWYMRTKNFSRNSFAFCSSLPHVVAPCFTYHFFANLSSFARPRCLDLRSELLTKNCISAHATAEAYARFQRFKQVELIWSARHTFRDVCGLWLTSDAPDQLIDRRRWLACVYGHMSTVFFSLSYDYDLSEHELLQFCRMATIDAPDDFRPDTHTLCVALSSTDIFPSVWHASAHGASWLYLLESE